MEIKPENLFDTKLIKTLNYLLRIITNLFN
jgi:hypothetical protein